MSQFRDHKQAAFSPTIEPLEARLLLTVVPIISEFEASNVTGILDYEDKNGNLTAGSHDDWVEICNPSSQALDLTGWRLREGKSSSNYTEWVFPAMTLGPGEFRIVFATGYSLKDPTRELHANFTIAKSGEYLGLADPNGNVVQEFNPFPQQYNDMSYGVGQTIDEIKLVSAGATAKYMVPTNGNLGTTWTTVGFGDTSWSSGTTGIGFANLVSGFAVWRYQGNIPQVALASAQSVIDTPAYQTSPAVTQTASTINYLATGGSGHFTGDHPFPGFTAGAAISNVVVQANGIVTIPTAGDWTFGVNSDDGFRLTVGTQIMEYDGLRTASDTMATFHFNTAGNYDLSLLYFQATSTSEVELYAASGAYTSWTGNFRLVGDTGNGGLTVRSQPFTGGSGTTSAFANLIQTDVKSVMEPATGTSYSAIYTRIHFDVADLSALQSLTLKMEYDDGYVAYLNGVEIASKNAPASPAYNSVATASRTDSQATVFENVDVSQYLSLLTATNNVLAIEELNVSATDGDLLVLPELSQINYLGQGNYYFVTPTPGAPNSSDYWMKVANTQVDHARGFYSSPFDLAITTTTVGATIMYTLDGSEPTPTHGTRYTGPIHISTTSTVQSMAYLSGYTSTGVDTETYIFLADVLQQPSNPPGFPAVWGSGVTANYQMDPDVVNNPQYSGTIEADLRAIPTLSIVIDPNLMFGASGLYLNPGQTWEQPASFEWINPDGTTAFQIDAGLRMQGGAGRGDGNLKHSFRIMFRTEYSGGDGLLDYDLFGTGAAQQFNDLTIRAGFNDVWPNNGSATYLSDRWTAQTGLDMGDVATHGTFVQLYINGLYWGLYNPVERPDDFFSATYYGGTQDDYDTYSVEGLKTGTADGWNLLQTLTTGSAAQLEANWPQIQQKLDINEFCDYMLTNQFGGNWDWPWNNWWATYDHNPSDNGMWRFFSWDGEGNLWDVNANKVNDAGGPGDIFQRLRAIPEFRLAFADRVQKFLFDGGALTPAANQARYSALAGFIDPAIVGESARWGDGYNDSGTPLTLDANWLPQVNWVLNTYFPARTNIVIAQYQAAGLFPKYTDVTTPEYAINGTAKHGGTIQPGDKLTMSTAIGTIYYTLDGSDPKTSGLLYTGPITLTAGEVVHARAVNANGVWSALQDATFYIDLAPAVRITELMYNPPAPTASEIAAGFTDNNEFEFIELTNIGSQSMPLVGMRFDNGVNFTFPVMSIDPQQRIVVVSNEAAFRFRYPNYTGVIAGTYTGQLNNNGEEVELDDPIGGIIQDFTYNNSWYGLTDGEGCSLTVVDPNQSLDLWSEKDGWRPSALSGGSPGMTDTPLPAGCVVINELLTHQDLPTGDEIELHNTTDQPIDISGWLLSDSVHDSAGNLTLDKYRIAAGTVIPADGYVTFTQTANFGIGSGDPGSRIGFGLSELGDDLYLSNSVLVNGQWVLGGYRDHESFGAAPNGMSFGLVQTSSGEEDFTLLSAVTIGSANAPAYTGPLAINEVMYHPPEPTPTEAAAGFTNAEDFEYVEILNASSTPQDLTDFYVGGGIGFSFGWMPASVPLNGAEQESETLERGATATWSTAGLANDNYEVLVKWSQVDGNGDALSLDGKAQYQIMHSGATNLVTLDQGNSSQFNSDGWVSLGTYAFNGTGSVCLTRGSDNPDNWTIADQVEFVRPGQTVTVSNPVLDSYFTTNFIDTGKSVLAPGQMVVIARDTDAFSLRYGLDGVPLAGQYAGNLNNDGDSVKLFQQGDYQADTGYIPYIREDYVNYQTSLPWPVDAAGGGASLCRIDPTRYGNDVGSWASSTNINGTPGQPNVWSDRTPPTVPTGLQASVALNPSRISLSWTASLDPQTGVSLYDVYRNGVLYGTSSTPSFVDSAAQAETTYSYQVLAVNPSGFASALSSPASLAIPGIVSYALTDTTRIEVLFTEPMQDGATGGGVGNLANYTFTGGTLVSAALDPANPARVVFTTSVMQLNQAYSLSVTGLQTASGNQMPTPQEIDFTYAVEGTGTILREAWLNIPGSNVSDLTSNAAYPNSPSWRELDTVLGGPANWADNYGSRLRGYVTPPATGLYTFYIAGDDSASLYLSTDSNPANKSLIASVASPTGLTEWTKYASQVSVQISLVAGQKYYIEVLQKESTGTDGVNVAWQWTAHGTTYPLEGPIPSMRLSPWTDASYDLTGPTAPSNLTATPVSSTQVRLNWSAASDPQSGVSQYNIYRSGQYVATTAGLTYTDSGLSQTVTYSYTVTASNGSKFEGAASNFASAQPGPSLISASPIDDQHIKLTFGKPVSEIPAGTIANYTLTDSVGRVIAITAAAWDDVSQKIVTLTLGEHLVDETNYTFTARNVTDTNGVTLDANTQKAIRFTTVCTGLLGWWTFDTNAGSVATDFSGAGHDMTVSNATWEASGKIGGAYLFNGTTSVIQDPNAGSYLNGLSAFTFTAWIKSTSTGSNLGFYTLKTPSAEDRYGGRYVSYSTNSGLSNVIRVSVPTTTGSGGQIWETQANKQSTSWQHIAVVWTAGQNIVVYINGVAMPDGYESQVGSGVLTSITTLMLGKGPKDSTTSWSGMMDDVRIYGRALSATEVAEIVNQTPLAADDGPYTASLNTTLTIDATHGVLANDSDPDPGNGLPGDHALTAVPVDVTSSSHGTVTLQSDGSFNYTPTAGYLGAASFTYRAYDGLEYSRTATVTLQVAANGLVPPTATMVAVSPNPRKDPVSTVSIVFSKYVTGLDANDLLLTCNGGGNLLNGGQTVTTTDHVTWTVGGLSGVTAASGYYSLTVVAAGSGIADQSGTAMVINANETWSTDSTPPTAAMTAVSPNPRNSSVSSVVIAFSEPITGLTLAGLKLQCNGGANLLTASQSLSTLDNMTWTLNGLSSLTGTGGTYVLTLTAAGSGIIDAVGNPLAGNASDTWVTDVTPPTASMAAVSPNPRNTPVSTVAINFSESVSAFDVGDLKLTCNGGANLLTGNETLTTTNNVNWTLGGISGLTAAGGSYVLTLTAAGSGIVDAVGNPLAGNASDTWSVDVTPPTGAITAVSPDLRSTPVSTLTLVFSEAVTGLDLSDLKLVRDNGANLLTAAQSLTTADNITWTLADLSDLTVASGTYNLSLSAASSGVTDMVGNPLAGDMSEVWTTDSTPPTAQFVTVKPSPRNSPLASLGIIFSKSVVGLDIADMTLTCNGGPNLLTAAQTVTSANGARWTLNNLSDITAAAGTYSLTLTAAGSGIVDTLGNALVTGAGETWSVDLTPPTVAIAAVTPDPRTTSVSTIPIVFSEPVVGFDLADLTLARDGGANLLDGNQTLTTTDFVTWTLGGLDALTAASGTYTLSLAALNSGITDNAGNALAADASDTWTNTSVSAPPQNVTVLGPASGNEGDTLHYTGSATGDAPLTYTWDVSKNGTWGYAGGSGVDLTAFSFVPNDNAPYQVKLTVLNAGGQASQTQAVTVANVAPTPAITGAPASSPEGTPITLGSTVSDPGTLDTFTYAWVVKKNGTQFATGTDAGITFTPDDNGTYTAALTVTDDDGGVGAATATITVTNVAPTATITGAPASSPEGTAITLGSTVSDPGSADTFTYAWVVKKNGTQFATGTDAGITFTPDDDGTYTAALTVTDDDGGVGAATATIAVTNVAPTATITGAPASSPEGTAITLGSTVSDPGTLDTFTYAWVVKKNGTQFATGTDAGITFTPDDNGTYTAALTVTDDDGGVGAATATITVTNVAPTATITGAPASSPEGTAITLGSTVSDPGSADTFTYGWVIKKNGVQFATGTDPGITFTPDDDGTYTAALTVTDDDGGVGAATATIAVTNVAPTPAITGVPASSPEGTAITLGSTVSDPGTLDTFTYAWVVKNNGTQFATGTDAGISFTPDDNGTYTAALTVTDDDGGVGAATATIAVTNVAPTATITGAPASSPEGTAITLGSTVSDPGTADTFTYAWVVKKNGTQFATGTDAGITFTPDDNGTYTAALTVTDDDGGVGAATATIAVTNVAPTATITGAPASWPQGTAISLGSTVSDPGTADTFTYGWVVKKNGVPFAAGADSGITFTPDSPGTYEAALTVTDDGGGVGSEAATIVVTEATAPTVAITPVSPSPRNAEVANITITFSEAVTGFGLEDLSLTRNSAPVSLAGATLDSADGGLTWTLAGLADATGISGSYALTLTAAGSGITGEAGSVLVAGASTTWAANYAPVLNPGGSMWLTEIAEDSAPGAGTLVSAMLASAGGGAITDGDSSALEGIAVVAADNTAGTWQFSLDGGAWTDFGSPSAGAARLLRDTDSVRFVPAANFNGTVSAGLTFRAWDRTTGQPGGTADLSASQAVGGLTAFSDAVGTAGIVVDAVNDKPTASGQSATTELGQGVDLVLGANDVETAYAGLTFNVPARAGHGTLTQIAHGTYRYDPDYGFIGEDSFQFTVSDDGDPAGTHGGGGDLTSDPATVTIQVTGWQSPLDAHGTGTYYDASNELVKVTLTGGGTGQLLFARQPVAGNGLDVGLIVLAGTGPKSALTITTTGKGSTTTVGGIEVGGECSFGTITGKTASLAGAVIVPGLLGALTLDDALPGSRIDVDAAQLAPGTTQLAVTFDRVADTAANTHSEPIKSITAVEWTNAAGSDIEQIVAPWIGAITITGRKASPQAVPPVGALAGDFSAGLALSGAGVPAKGMTLGTVKISGSVAGTTWVLNGGAGALAINGVVAGWALEGGGAGGAGLGTIKSLTLGDVQGATVLADGAVGPVKALNWVGGSIAADSLTSLAISGRKAAAGVAGLAGDFQDATVTLRANATPALGKATITALGSATIAGSLVDSAWAVDMDAGPVTVGGTVTGWTFAGADDGDAVDLLSVKSLTLGDVADASVTIQTAQLNVAKANGPGAAVTAGGVLGAVKALRWAAGAIEAGTMASLAISGRKATATAGAVLGDFGASVVLAGSPTPLKPAAGAVSIAHDLAGSVWQVTGAMTTLTVAHTALNSTVRTSGSITGVTLGAADGSTILAGVTNSLKLDPTQVTSADVNPLATIGSLAIKGWTVPAGTAIPDFLTDSSFLAPSLGTVSLLNASPGTWDLFAQAQATSPNLRIKSVSLKDTRDPKNADKNWTWIPGKPVPPGGVGATNAIP